MKLIDQDCYKVGDEIEVGLTFAADPVEEGVADGYIKGIASTASTDAYGHKVMSGAFDESIRIKGLNGPTGVKLLAFHDWSKPAGVIKQLKTQNGKLNIEAQLSLSASYVKDLYEVTKDIGGLNFSVGFRLQEYKFVDEEEDKNDNAWLVVEKGDLMEVSVVPFPANEDAQMTFVKNGQANTLAEFERALVAQGICRSRTEAKKITLAVKSSSHLFQTKTPPGVEPLVIVPPHPLLDASRLQPVAELIAKAKATLSGSR
jgi:HK97 family phage prohead protease